MKLISDIINELIDTDKSISSPLLKTKVLATRVKNSELLSWVNNELNGYETHLNIPVYRKGVGIITGTYLNGFHQFNNQPIPLGGLPSDVEESFRSMNMYGGVETLESLKDQDNSGLLVMHFSAEQIAMIQENGIKMGNTGLQILSVKKSTSINAVTRVLASVRSKLLDFMLKMEDEFQHITEIEDLLKSNDQINTILNQTIINNNGDGNILNTGENSKIDASIKIIKGNQESLKSLLLESGIAETDIMELTDIIDLNPPLDNNTLGEKVNSWIKNMVGKSLDGTWQVGIGAAGTLLADAIKKYYGLP